MLANHAEQRSRPACSEEHIVELTARLGRRWRAAGDLELRCAGGRFPERGFFVDARWDRERRVGIVAFDRDRDIVPFVRLVSDRSLNPVARAFLVTDLDGDGIDEVIDAWRRELHGVSADRLIFWTTTGTELAYIEGPDLNAYRPGLGSCEAHVEIGSQAVAITVRTAHGLPPTDCLPEGRHCFVMRGGRLVKLERPSDRRAPPTPTPSTFTWLIDRTRS